MRQTLHSKPIASGHRGDVWIGSPEEGQLLMEQSAGAAYYLIQRGAEAWGDAIFELVAHASSTREDNDCYLVEYEPNGGREGPEGKLFYGDEIKYELKRIMMHADPHTVSVTPVVKVMLEQVRR
jgi:hypothetical protein